MLDRRNGARGLGGVLLALVVAACGGLPMEDGRASQPVIGGQLEAGHPAVAALVERAYPSDPICGATRIGEGLAVTAAHCLEDLAGVELALRFGALDDGPVVPVRVAISHPGFDLSADDERRFEHDLALLHLDGDEALEAIAIGVATQDATARFVGYGLASEGDFNTAGGPLERRSAVQRIDAIDELSIVTAGVDGGLCWGDSGGALLNEDGSAILGVLSDFADDHFVCELGNRMIFTSLDAERSFLDAARGLPCALSCDDARLADGEARAGFRCEAGCAELVETIAPPPFDR